MKDAMTFLQALQTDPRARELVRKMEIPEDQGQVADCYLSLAGQLGYSLTKEEILEAVREMSRAQREKTGKALEKMSLSENDLERIAGGMNPDCDSTYNEEGEWCWFSDSCIVIICKYDEDENFDNLEFNPDEILRGDHCAETSKIDFDAGF